jgi:hypothetical protein
MVSELQTYFNEICRTGAWSDPDPDLCGCRGSGWWNSEVDTWHKCRYHRPGAPHPEWATDEELEEYWNYDEGFLIIQWTKEEWEAVAAEEWARQARMADDDIPF